MNGKLGRSLRQPGIFGQVNWDTYTLLLLGFRTAPGETPEKITETLDKAALKLLEAYPFLAGQVINEGRSKTSSGTYRIVPYPPHDGKSPVRSKDCSSLCPSYDEIFDAHAPFSKLDGDILCPMRGFGHQYDDSIATPVLIIQANFIRGGLLLCFASMHNALDMNGQGVLVQQFAAICRGEDLDPRLVADGNQDADTVVPLLKNGEVRLAHEDLLKPSSLNQSGGPPTLPPGTAPWNYWHFPREKLVELKRLASGGSTWVSTNDAITAFYMQRLTAVRLAADRVDRDETVRCIRAANGRAKLNPPVSEGFLGHLVGVAETEWNAATADAAPLSQMASEVRQSLQRIDDHYVRSLATLIQSTDDKTTIFYGAKKQLGKDIMISSWAQLEFSTCDFGPVLGTPDFVRRAKLDQVPDLAYIMPRDSQGDMALGSSLLVEDFKGLANDPVWKRYATLIG